MPALNSVQSDFSPTLGAHPGASGEATFRVWAPAADKVELLLDTGDTAPVTMERGERGYFTLTVADLPPGSTYRYRLDGTEDVPDPASRHQPQGVHGPSALVDRDFAWTDGNWSGLPWSEYIIYELHVGTFTGEGTFDGAIAQLPALVELGVTAIELMPVAQFPGGRNWGYDGVLPFAVQDSYGGPEGLRRLVDAAHGHGLAVVMDVVYNHLGPEGNVLHRFGPYFTDRYATPWGEALNFDGPGSDEVRRYFIENAVHWIEEYHIDALRLDAVHAICDDTARPFLTELGAAVRAAGVRLGRQVHTIAESSRQDPRFVTPEAEGGLGLDAQWCDDLHHALRTELTDLRSGYYGDYRGFADIAKAYRENFVIDGRYSEFLGRRHGVPAGHLDPRKLVVCTQNHDQVGNRPLGERLDRMTGPAEVRLAAAAVLLSPFTPMLFMGEEYGETAPFLYFISHGDPDLVEAVRKGRAAEFTWFFGDDDPPDPQAEETFRRCRLDHDLRTREPHRSLYQYYRHLIQLRRSLPPTVSGGRWEVGEHGADRLLVAHARGAGEDVVLLLHFGREETSLPPLPPGSGSWELLLDSHDARWGGEGARLPDQVPGEAAQAHRLPPLTAAVYRRPTTMNPNDSHASA